MTGELELGLSIQCNPVKGLGRSSELGTMICIVHFQSMLSESNQTQQIFTKYKLRAPESRIVLVRSWGWEHWLTVKVMVGGFWGD